jgi:hypothetical protein
MTTSFNATSFNATSLKPTSFNATSLKTTSLKTTPFKIDYRNYPEFMFAMIAAYLPPSEALYVSRAAGDVTFRHQDSEGCTYKNGLLHSYEDKPAVSRAGYQMWYKNGELHRDGDLPAYVSDGKKQWYSNGVLHRDGKPAFIEGRIQEFYIHGVLQ